MVLRGLPFDEHDRLVAVGQRQAGDADLGRARDPSRLMFVAPQNYPQIVGRVIPLELLEEGRDASDAGYEAIGVMPPQFSYPVATVVIHALALVAAGVALGGCLAWYSSEAARAFLFGITPTDPRAFIAAALSLLAAAAIATIVPAWRAASIDPVSALRAAPAAAPHLGA